MTQFTPNQSFHDTSHILMEMSKHSLVLKTPNIITLTFTYISNDFFMLRGNHMVLYSLMHCFFAIGMEHRFRHAEKVSFQ